jgi:hypothetical protein
MIQQRKLDYFLILIATAALTFLLTAVKVSHDWAKKVDSEYSPKWLVGQLQHEVDSLSKPIHTGVHMGRDTLIIELTRDNWQTRFQVDTFQNMSCD